MAFPGLYSEVTHLPTKPTTCNYCTYCRCTHARTRPTDVPVAVFTYLLYLPLPTARARTMPTAVQYISSTYYVCDKPGRYEPILRLHCVRMYCTYMYVLHAPTDDARTCIEEKLPAAVSTYLLLYVRIYCTYPVLVYLVR